MRLKEIKVRLSGLDRVFKKGYAFHVLVREIVEENALRIEKDQWVVLKPVVEPIIDKLLERGLLVQSEVKKQWECLTLRP